jgi:hypothetical protein
MSGESGTDRTGHREAGLEQDAKGHRTNERDHSRFT